VACRFQGKAGHIVLDQLRTVDHEQLRKRLGAVTPRTLQAVLGVLAELFEP
jgi:mRNA interferase MazF